MPSEGVVIQPAGWDFRSVYRFGRFSALSFTLMTILLGAATAEPRISLELIFGLLGIGLAFHLFAYIHNDFADLAIDLSEPLRRHSPLVLGMIRPRTALAVALLQVPLAFGLHWWLGGDSRAATALAVALLLLAVYNVWGKRVPVPVFSDLVQAFGWVTLAVYGALMARRTPNAVTGTLASLIVVYVLMINGIHGGLRDLANDYRCGARTTAILLGAKPDAESGTLMPRRLFIYAIALQGLLLCIIALCLSLNLPRYDTNSRLATAAIVVLVNLGLAYLTRTAVRRHASKPDLIQAGILHLVISLGLLYWPFALYLDWPARLAGFAVYIIPVTFMCAYNGLRGEVQ
jgi:4-hydroxybenzoate polyprenyltransferase